MKFYKNYFSDYNSISFNHENIGNKNSYWLPTALFKNKKNFCISGLIRDFQSQNIDARSFFWPLSSLSFFSQIQIIKYQGISQKEPLIYQVFTT